MKPAGRAMVLYLVAGAMAAGLASVADAQMNRCVDKNGKVTYQQRPCDGAVVVPAPAASKAEAGAAAALPGERTMRELAFELGVHDFCAPYAVVEDEDEHYISDVIAWSAKHQAVMREIETVPAYQEAFRQGRSSFSTRFGPGDRRSTPLCIANWKRLLSSNP